MRRIRLYTDQPLEPNRTINLAGPPAHHLLRVLRSKAGQPVTLFNGDGAEHDGKLVEITGRDECNIELTASRHPATESPLLVTLAQAIGRGDRMDWCLQKAVELGVSMILPISTERTEVKLNGDRAEKRRDHWQQVVISACEQSGRVCIPPVALPQPLDDIHCEPGNGFYLDPLADSSSESLAIQPGQPVMIVIGPEGGFSEIELAGLERRGFRGLRLGPRVLRTETAGPAAIAMLQTRFGDW